MLPNKVSVTVSPSFWETFLAAHTMIRFLGALMIVHAVFPLAGVSVLVLSYVFGAPLGPGGVFAAFSGFLFTPLVTVVGIWSARRANKLAQGPFTYSFDSEGMHTSGATFEQTIKWPPIRRVRQTERFIFIFISPSRAQFIPVKSLIERGALDDLRAIFRQYSDFR